MFNIVGRGRLLAARVSRGRYGRIAFTFVLIAGGVAAFGSLKAEPKLKASGGLEALAQAPAPSAKAKAEPKPKASAASQAPTAPVTPAPAAVVAPSAPEKVNNTMPAWTVGCFSPARAAAPDCKIEQRLYVKETGRNISIAVVNIPGATRQPTLFLQLPNSLALQQGVSLSIDDGAATPVLLQSCDGNGCYATLVLTPALLERMKTGKVMAVKATAANREPLTFQHLLTDFAVAYEAAK